MQLEATTSGGYLGVRYHHTNERADPLYFHNHLLDWFGILSGGPAKGVAMGADSPPTSALAAVFAHGDDGVLLEQGDPAPSRVGLMAFAPRVPFAQRLLPSESTTVTIWLPLPLDEWHPNEPPKPELAEPRWVRSVTMNVLTQSERGATFVREHPNFRGLYQISGGERRALYATVTLESPVLLRVRRDPIYRAE